MRNMILLDLAIIFFLASFQKDPVQIHSTLSKGNKTYKPAETRFISKEKINSKNNTNTRAIQEETISDRNTFPFTPFVISL